ncbi:unnamed protein product [Soboliphyme baturini]|uniref:Dynactin subunit 5 n=1 Tax=Soboliphyme baturini TaxID=241478 RepID=A0A183IUI3_9BILA|nr:unnamed protein product [Soboliphyme baturini]
MHDATDGVHHGIARTIDIYRLTFSVPIYVTTTTSGLACCAGESAIKWISTNFCQEGVFIPLHIGDYVFIGENSVVTAAQVGSYVRIGQNCVIGKRSVVKDCCVFKDNTVLETEAVIPSFSIVAGQPGRIVGTLPDGAQQLITEAARIFYNNFKSREQDKKVT